jgi:uncharacterized protein DUF4112
VSNRALSPAEREAHRTGLPLSEAEQRRYRRLEQLADLLDNAIAIPGTGWRIGLDPLLGLVPGLGDALGAAASAWILIEAARFGASRPVLLRMLYNITVDTVLGAVPGAGDLFDFVWKSDSKNLALLRRHLALPGETHRASRRLLVGILLAVAGVAVGSAVAVILLLKYLITLSPLF